MRKMFSLKQLEEIAKKTIESNPINSEYPINSPYEEIAEITLANAWLNGLTASNVYGKMIKENNILFVVLSFQLVNSTESAISTNVNVPITNDIIIPTEVADKIYRKDGSKVSGAVTSSDDITGLSLKKSSGSSGGIGSSICNLFSTVANKLNIWASSNTGEIELEASSYMNIDCRFFLVL